MPTSHVPTYLSNLHPHERDQYISFQEEGHVYTVHGATDYTSVTTFIHSNFRVFDSESIVNKIISSKKHQTDPTYKYYQKPKTTILSEWSKNGEEASRLGTQMHYHIELYYNEEGVDDPSIEYQYFLQFHRDHILYKAYRTEYLVYHEEYKISGSIDMLFLNPDGETYSIYDWKRVKSIEYESYGNQGALTECISTYGTTSIYTIFKCNLTSFTCFYRHYIQSFCKQEKSYCGKRS